MGQGSQRYATYYGVCSVLYVSISVAAFVQLSVFREQCQSVCPLLIRDGMGYNFSACSCFMTQVAGSVIEHRAWGFEDLTAFKIWQNAEGDEKEQLSVERFKAVTALGRECYICNSEDPGSTSIYSPCESFGLCTSKDVLGFSETSNTSDACSILTSPTATLRGSVAVVLFAFALLYLLMAVTAGLLSWAFLHFVDKWADDYANLSKIENGMAYIAKNAPIVVRMCNFFVLFFIVYNLIITHVFDICSTDLDPNGEASFFRYSTIITVAALALWFMGCLFGTVFNASIPKDTQFYTPKVIIDQKRSCSQLCCEKCVIALIRSGP